MAILPSLIEKGIVYTSHGGLQPASAHTGRRPSLSGESQGIEDGLYEITSNFDLQLVTKVMPRHADPVETPPETPAKTSCTGTIVYCPASPSIAPQSSRADSHQLNLDIRNFQADDPLDRATLLLQDIATQLENLSSLPPGQNNFTVPDSPPGGVPTAQNSRSTNEAKKDEIAATQLERVQIEYGDGIGCPIAMELFFSATLSLPPKIKLYSAGSPAAAPSSDFGFAKVEMKYEPQTTTEERLEPIGEKAYRLGVAGIPTQQNGLREFWITYEGRANRIWLRSNCPLVF